MVNNLGGTSNLELLIVTNAAIRHLGTNTQAVMHFKLHCAFLSVDKMKLKVVRVYQGSFMTSLEMAGVSFTLLDVSSYSFVQWLGIGVLSVLIVGIFKKPMLQPPLDLPVSAPGWPNASTMERDDLSSIPACSTATACEQRDASGEPKTSIGKFIYRGSSSPHQTRPRPVWAALHLYMY